MAEVGAEVGVVDVDVAGNGVVSEVGVVVVVEEGVVVIYVDVASIGVVLEDRPGGTEWSRK